MSWLKPRKAASGVRHVEIWGEIEANNRFLRRLAIGASVWAFVALAGAAYALDLALFQPLAFHVDADGRSTFTGRLRDGEAPTEPEVRYVARQFLGHYAAMNSLTIESDLADAWNLMTSELRAEHERQLADYRREHDRDFVAFVKEQGIQMELEFPADKVRVIEHNGKAWSVRLVGVVRTWPLNRIGDPAATAERDLEAIVTLVRCPRTEQTPNGLLVAKVSTRYFVAETTGAPTPATPAKE
jgi:hypothetical protein